MFAVTPGGRDAVEPELVYIHTMKPVRFFDYYIRLEDSDSLSLRDLEMKDAFDVFAVDPTAEPHLVVSTKPPKARHRVLWSRLGHVLGGLGFPHSGQLCHIQGSHGTVPNGPTRGPIETKSLGIELSDTSTSCKYCLVRYIYPPGGGRLISHVMPHKETSQ